MTAGLWSYPLLRELECWRTVKNKCSYCPNKPARNKEKTMKKADVVKLLKEQAGLATLA